MYTSYIGHKFLRLYNEREGKRLSAREFFDEVMFPVFFNAERHLINVSGSSFFQKVSEKEMVGGASKAKLQLQRLHRTIESEPPNGSSMVGYAAGGQDGTTSGQVTSSVSLPLSKEDVYASWIGAGFGIYVGEKLSFYSEAPGVLWTIFDGWDTYRNFLNQSPSLKGNQIETWNARWICNVFKRNYMKEEVFIPPTESKKDPKTKKEIVVIDPVEWTEIILALCRKFGDRILMINSFGFGSANISAGFFPVKLYEIQKMYEVRDRLFSSLDLDTEFSDTLDLLYRTEFGFRKACEQGQIGLYALKPKDIDRDFSLAKSKEDKQKHFIFKIWLIAMLNNNEFYDASLEAAAALHRFRASETRTNVRKELVKRLFEPKGVNAFVSCLADIIELDNTEAEAFEKLVRLTNTSLPRDQFPLFQTLIRFGYFSQDAKKA
jgi:hypothetical protein